MCGYCRRRLILTKYFFTNAEEEACTCIANYMRLTVEEACSCLADDMWLPVEEACSCLANDMWLPVEKPAPV
jgi:hypothetical protein